MKGTLVRVDKSGCLLIKDVINDQNTTIPMTFVMEGAVAHVDIVSIPYEQSLNDKIVQLFHNGITDEKELVALLDVKPSIIKTALNELKSRNLIPAKQMKKITKGSRKRV
jgi:hypothetical protein